VIAERAIVCGPCEPAQGLAWDEALVRSPVDRPALLVWRTAPAVVIGRFQRADWEVDPAACAAAGVRVWRRFTGGGAVYLDAGTVCAALALPAAHPAASASIPEMYAPLLDGMVHACLALGADASRDERTVRVGGRKVTGIAAHRGRDVTLVHGTLLVAADLDALRACLAGPRDGPLEGRPRPAASRPDHVTLVGGDVDAAERAVVEALALPGVEPVPLTATESETAARLMRERYVDRAWHAGPWADVTPDAVRAVLGA
jgi:lipoate-protein ligase A